MEKKCISTKWALNSNCLSKNDNCNQKKIKPLLRTEKNTIMKILLMVKTLINN